MSERPYFAFKAKELEALLLERELSAQELKDLLSELELRRDTPKNERIARVARERLRNSTDGNQSAPSPSSRGGRPQGNGFTSSLIKGGSESPVVKQREETPSTPTVPLVAKEIVLRAGFPWRFFGITDVVLCEVSGVLSVRNAEQVIDVGRGEKLLANVGDGFLLKKFCISRATGDVTLRLTKAQANALKGAFDEWSNIELTLLLINELDVLLASDRYLNFKTFRSWRESAIALLRLHTDESPRKVLSSTRHLFDLVSRLDMIRGQHNLGFSARKQAEYKDFFRCLEKTPLTDSQIRAALCDEDATLVNAGAGTGKTSTVVGRIAYLIESGEACADEILALAFGKDAAAELRDRVKSRLGVEVEVRTFHSLGMQLLGRLEGHRLQIADTAKDERAFLALVARLIYEISQSPDGSRLLIDFVSTHRYPARYLDQYDSQHDYLRYLQKHEPRTLRGELVKSFEELLIADWLYINGVRYEYEYPYAHPTATKLRKQYKPDFYLIDYDIYLEHFGIGRDGQTAPGIDAEKYRQGIAWKRELHKSYGTTLLETYSWQRKEGVLLRALTDLCEENDITLRPFGSEQMRELLGTREVSSRVVSLFRDFLSVFKENQHSISDLREQVPILSASDPDRAKCFFSLFELLYDAYQSHLVSRQEVDFSDLIKLSTEALQRGSIRCNYKRVIVDEYQDISTGRYLLLREILRQNEDCRITCVGDDWQSIYGFTGSDVDKSTRFDHYFEGSAVVALEQTFRFTQPIVELSSDFVRKNPNQLRKAVRGRVPEVAEPISLFLFESESSTDLFEVLRCIDQSRPKRRRWKVFLLGRYSFREPDNLHELQAAHPMLELEFLTVHASKGREADAVVILGVGGGRYGFPGSIENDPLMSYVVPGSSDIEYAEERRVMYVAMTRAREKVCFVCARDNPSGFLFELMEHSSVSINGASEAAVGRYGCPECGGRLTLRFPERRQGYCWRCEFMPRCSGQAKMCSVCLSAPTKDRGGCLSPSCRGPVANKK
jgi:DNA helicase IV